MCTWVLSLTTMWHFPRPARFAGDRVSTTMVSLMDMFATVVDVVGHDSDTLLAGRPVDGRSLLPLIDLPDPTRPDDPLAYDHHPDGLLFYCGRTVSMRLSVVGSGVSHLPSGRRTTNLEGCGFRSSTLPVLDGGSCSSRRRSSTMTPACTAKVLACCASATGGRCTITTHPCCSIWR